MINDSRFEIISDLSLIPLRSISENYLFEMTGEIFRCEMIDADRHFEMILIDYFRFILD